MKQLFSAMFIMLTLATSGYAEKLRTITVYKQHIQSAEHDQGNFDHHMHHMLYLSGVADAYAVLNQRGVADGRERLYCLPDSTMLNGNDYIRILETAIYQSEPPLPGNMNVAEALLVALQEEFPCQQ